MTGLPYRRGLVVANPISGRGRGHAGAEELARGLREHGIGCELHLTSARGDARARVARLEPEVDLVAVVGGDGTVSEVLDGLSRREVPVAVLPLGTANVMALDLDLPREPAATVAMIARGRTQAIDLARVNGERLSFLVSGVGFDGGVIRELERKRRGPITKAAYLSAGLRALRSWRPVPLEVEIDGERHPRPCFQVLVSNIVHYGGFRVLSRERRLDDGLLEVYLFERGSRLALARAGVRALLAGLPGGSCVLRRGRQVRVKSEQPVPCHVDGDAFAETPVEIVVEPVQSRLCVP